ncbi:MAG: DUF5615 family PIN-like protein [Chloroflexi bacterium]|nr:DUF5615 family PIN-like protein [Chloroflexota bacterium]
MPWQRLLVTNQDIRDARADQKKATFLLDEGVDPEYAELIHQRGHKAEHAADVGLSGHPDENILAYAQREDRILLTHDSDFLDNRLYPPSRNPGIIILPQAAGVSALVTAVEDLLDVVAISRDLWRSTKITTRATGHGLYAHSRGKPVRSQQLGIASRTTALGSGRTSNLCLPGGPFLTSSSTHHLGACNHGEESDSDSLRGASHVWLYRR